MYQGSLCQFTMGTKQPSSISYVIMKTATTLQVLFNQFQMTTDGCIYDHIQYEFAVTGSSLLPSFIVQNQGNISIIIQTNNMNFEGIYNLTLTGSLNPYLIQTHSVALTMTAFPYPNTGPPAFQGSLQSPYIVSLGADKQYALPNIKDPDGDSFFVTVMYDNPLNKGTPQTTLPSFVTFSSQKNILSINPTDSSDVATFQFSIILTDENKHPKSQAVPFQIKVELVDMSSLLGGVGKNKKGEVTQYIGMQIVSISSLGVLTLAFNQSVFNVAFGPSQFNNQSLQISMLQAFTYQTFNVPWAARSVTPNQIVINLNFSDPTTVSRASLSDNLIVKLFKNSQILNNLPQTSQNASSINYQINQNFILSYPIPKQKVVITSSSQLSGGSLQQSAQIMSGSVNTVLFGNLILNILLQVSIPIILYRSSSIQMLWGTINTLQLIVIVALFNINFPSNSLFMFNMIGTISNFNLIPVYQTVTNLFKFQDNNPLNNNFSDMGYGTNNILQNLNTMLIIVMGIFGLIFFAFTLNFIIPSSGIVRRKFKSFHNAIFFSLTIRILLECQIELTLCSALNLVDFNFVLLGDQIDGVLSIFLGSTMIIMPIATLFFALTKMHRLSDPEFKAKYGSLYEGLRTNSRISLLCAFTFTSRRLLLIVVTMLLQNYPAFQIMSFILLSELNLMYLIFFKPYEDPSTNYTEIFNEACIILVGYQIFVFSDFVTDPGIQFYTGYGLIGTVLFNFGVNVMIQVYQMLRSLPRACRKLNNSLCSKIAAKQQSQDMISTNTMTLADTENPLGFVEQKKPNLMKMGKSTPRSQVNVTNQIQQKQVPLKKKKKSQRLKGNAVNSVRKGQRKISDFTPNITKDQVNLPNLHMQRIQSDNSTQPTLTPHRRGYGGSQIEQNDLAFTDDHIPYRF